MATNCYYLLLPITKFSEQNIKDSSTAEKIFNFDKWLSEQKNTEIYKINPQITVELEKEFIELFMNPQIICLDSILNYGRDLWQKYKELKLGQTTRSSFRPFLEGSFGEDFHREVVYFYYFKRKNRIVMDIPIKINNIQIELGPGVREASILKYDKLKELDLNKMKDDIIFFELEKDFKSDLHLWAYHLLEIIKLLEDVKKMEYDFITWI
jgi:hypothetical protein